MLQQLLLEKKTYYTLGMWLVAGVISPWLALVVIVFHILQSNNIGETPVLFILGLWFVLALSDSMQPALNFAKTVKPFIIIVLGWIVFQRKYFYSNHFYQPFIPFFVIAVYCMFQSPNFTISLQKTLSYFLVLFVTPSLVNYYLNNNKEKLLTHLVILGVVVLGTGSLLRFAYPAFVTAAGGRFAGIFGNPNALGIYSFLLLMLYTVIKHYHPNIFDKRSNYIIYFVIALSIYWAGSRGAIFGSLLFLFGTYLFKRSKSVGILVMIAIIIAYQLVLDNIEAIIIGLKLQEYFRLDTLESGSGRDIAFNFAWEHIQYNYYLGLGFGYTEILMRKYREYFASLGHIGNAHNSYLTIWLDTGLIGLVAFVYAWLKNFLIVNKFSFFAGAIFFAIAFSTNIESWLAGSLNPFTIILVIILTMLSNPNFYTPINNVSNDN